LEQGWEDRRKQLQEKNQLLTVSSLLAQMEGHNDYYQLLSIKEITMLTWEKEPVSNADIHLYFSNAIPYKRMEPSVEDVQRCQEENLEMDGEEEFCRTSKSLHTWKKRGFH